MSEDNNKKDPLMDLINRHAEIINGSNNDEQSEQPVEPEQISISKDVENDDPYGLNDRQKELEEAEKQEALEFQKIQDEERSKYLQEQKEKPFMPPNEKSMQYHDEAIKYQEDKIAIVTNMVNEVTKKHNITSGGIPDDKRMMVMGELIDIYHTTGEVITPEFEEIILQNWEGVNDDETSNEENKKDSPEEVKSTEQPTTINIDIHDRKDPVTINIDDSILPEKTESRVININVREVSEEELLKSVIVNNSDKAGIITPYDSGINDVPVTLPFSGYRCVIRSINFADFLKIAAPMSQNVVDTERRSWSVIYDHIKNVSIGDFESFEDFLKKTSFNDKELLLWALLVATSDNNEQLSARCTKCEKEFVSNYEPRSIAHIDNELAPKSYLEIHNAGIGEEAIKVFNNVKNKHTEYLLPNSNYIVEIGNLSAYDYLVNKLPVLAQLYQRFTGEPLTNIQQMSPRDEEEQEKLMEFNYYSSHLLFIDAFIKEKDGMKYRYSDWDKIEEIIKTALSSDDSAILMQILQKKTSKSKVVSFYTENVKCPNCSNMINRIYISDIGQTLLFQVSRRFSNTQINLNEMD